MFKFKSILLVEKKRMIKTEKTTRKRRIIVKNKMRITTNKPKTITTQAKIDSNRNRKKTMSITLNVIMTMTLKGKPLNRVKILTKKWGTNKTDMRRKVLKTRMREKRRWKITMLKNKVLL